MSSPPAVRAVLLGASGRMGRAILAASAHVPGLRWVGAVASPGSAALGQDAGAHAGLPPNGVPLTGDLGRVLTQAQVALDFSHPDATLVHLTACRAAGTALLLGTTGHGARLEAEFAAAARELALMIAPNTSLGATLLLELTQSAARALPQFEASIREVHHREKRDAPSGTALALASAVRASRADSTPQIPIESRREGEVVGEHSVRFAGLGEELLLSHRALDRGVFARGAIAAALWLAPQPPGRYHIRDVLYGKTAT